MTESEGEPCTELFFGHFLAGKTDGARLKVGLENVYASVFGHSTDQIFTNVQGVPGPVLDATKLQKKCNTVHILSEVRVVLT